MLVAIACYDVHLILKSKLVHLECLPCNGSIACLVVPMQSYDLPTGLSTSFCTSFVGLHERTPRCGIESLKLLIKFLLCLVFCSTCSHARDHVFTELFDLF